MQSRNTNNIGIQCICWFYSQGPCYDARSYDLKRSIFHLINDGCYFLPAILFFMTQASRQTLTRAAGSNKRQLPDKIRKMDNAPRLCNILITNVTHLYIQSPSYSEASHLAFGLYANTLHLSFSLLLIFIQSLCIMPSNFKITNIILQHTNQKADLPPIPPSISTPSPHNNSVFIIHSVERGVIRSL